MTVLYWLAGILLLLFLLASAVFFVLYLGTGENIPRQRAVMFFRWGVLVVLTTFNIVVFKRVFGAIRDLMS